MLSEGKMMSTIAAAGGPKFVPLGYSNIRKYLEELERKGVVKSLKTGDGRGQGAKKMYHFKISVDVAGRHALGDNLWNQIRSARERKTFYEYCSKLADTLEPPFSAMRDIYKTGFGYKIQQLNDTTLAGVKLDKK